MKTLPKPPGFRTYRSYKPEYPIAAPWHLYLQVFPMVTTQYLPGTVLKSGTIPYLVRGIHSMYAIVADDPQNPFDEGISYAFLDWLPDAYPPYGQSFLKIHQWPAKAFPPDTEAKLTSWIQQVGWQAVHFPLDVIRAFEEIADIMDDHTWTGFKFVETTRQKIFYHKRVGYRVISPRPKNFQQRLMKSAFFIYILQYTRARLFRKPIWATIDPENWKGFVRIIKQHPWYRPTPGGFWFVSGRKGDPTSDLAIESMYRIVFRYKKYDKKPPPEPPPKRQPDTKPRPYAIDPEDKPDDMEVQRAIKSQSPFHLPRFTDEDWEKKHEEYIKAHGYEIRIPNWDDIIHIKLPPKTTKEQYEEYKSARKEGRPPRLPQEIVQYFDKRRQRYLAYLATPQPKWYRSYASILTALDDAQDALSSAVLLGKLAIRAAPRALTRFLGPLSWVMLGSELLTIAQKTMRAPWTPRRAKRRIWDMARENPFANMTSFKDPGKLFDQFHWSSAAIEFLQVTDNLLGIGLCIGPLFGTAADTVFGGLRALTGEPVSIYLPGQDKPALVLNASKQLKSAHAAAITNPILTDDDRIMLLFATALSANVLRPHLKGIHDSDRIPNSKDLIITAPRPRHPDTIDLLWEAGLNPEEHANLPLIDVKEALYDEWAMDIHARITTSNDLHITSFKNPEAGYFAAVLTFHAALGIFSALTRPGSIELRLRPDVHTLLKMLHYNMRPNPELPREHINQQLTMHFRQINNTFHIPRGKRLWYSLNRTEPLFTSQQDLTFPASETLSPEHIQYIEQAASLDRAIELAEHT